MGKTRTTHPHIQVLPEIKGKGEDNIIGDLHGHADCLEAVMKTMKPGDRLFIAGDLVDRGKKNAELIRMIIENKNVYAIRGNHEDLCLDGIRGLEEMAAFIKKHDKESIMDWATDTLKESPPQLINSTEQLILNHTVNGGEWLVKLFKDEIDAGIIKVNKNKKVTYAKNSEVKMIKDFMSDLPYLIHVRGIKPFNVVHADMPISDAELQYRILTGEGLSPEEVKYGTWARENSSNLYIKYVGNNKNSCITYVGHSITTDNDGAKPVRNHSNTVNLDVGAYYLDANLVANHTRGRCKWAGPGVKELNQDRVQFIEAVVNSHMAEQNNLIKFLKKAAMCTSWKKLAKLVGIKPEKKLKKKSEKKTKKKPSGLFKRKVKPVNDASIKEDNDLLACAIYNNAISEELLLNAKSSELRELLHCGLDANMYLSDGNTLLYHAVDGNKLDIMDALLEKDADPMQENIENDDTPLGIALDSQNQLSIGLMFTEYAKRGTSEIHAAVSHGNFELTKKLIAEYPFLNTSTNKGTTALHIATNNGQLALVTLLANNGADLDAKLISTGHTPLLISVTNNDTETTEALLERGADPDIALEVSGFTALHTAATEGNVEMVRILIEYEANPDVTISTTSMQVGYFFRDDDKATRQRVDEFLRGKNADKIEIKPEDIAQILGFKDIQEILQKAAEQKFEMENHSRKALRSMHQ